MNHGHALVDALLLGRLEGLPPGLLFLYARTGLLHLFSASGFHMGAALLLAKLGSRLLRPALPTLFSRRLTAFLLAIALMTFFGAATEWSSPLVRAYCFAALLAAAQLLEIRACRHWVFALSLALAYLFGRGSLLSFSLSALGMAGILYGSGTNIFTLALAPWLFTLPLVVWRFGLFSLASPLWNLSFGLLISFTVLPLAILDLLRQAAGIPWTGLKNAAAFAMEFFTAALERAERVAGYAYWVEGKSFLLLCLLLLLTYFFRRRRWAPLPALLALLLPLFWPTVKLALLDVGQGDSAYLLLRDQSRLVVDAGPAWKSWAPAPASLERIGIGRIDHLLLTHPDRDHIGGVEALFGRHRVGTLWLRESQLVDRRLLPALTLAARHGTAVRFLGAPPGLVCWLPPAPGGNESSPFCRAELAGGKSILLTGDAGFRSENWLLRTGRNLHADFLKVGHHGSAGSSGEDFLRRVAAPRALVSVGQKNRYGHPARETLRRLRDSQILRTDEDGTLLFY